MSCELGSGILLKAGRAVAEASVPAWLRERQSIADSLARHLGQLG